MSQALNWDARGVVCCGFERVRRIELPSSAWKAEVLAVELHPQLITMLQVGVYPEVQIRHNHDV
tara:strand:- start:4590 stop:4781 length:192 start_codon:yes stop_codon:yes gene_type:complete